MSYIKISSIRQIKHEVARLCRIIKKESKLDAFDFDLQNNLINLAKRIREKAGNLKVELYLYDDEYTLNYFTNDIRWTAGIGKDGLVTYCYIDKETPLIKGRFYITEDSPNDFDIILGKINDKI